MARYYVASGLNHDGKEYKRGDVVGMNEEAGNQLMDLGVLQMQPIEAPTPAQEPEEPAKPESADTAKVGGEQSTSGEPSLDASELTSQRSEAVDITPATEDMTRAELNQMASEKGIPQDTIEAAPNKAAVIDLIKNGAPASEPEQDPSKDL